MSCILVSAVKGSELALHKLLLSISQQETVPWHCRTIGTLFSPVAHQMELTVSQSFTGCKALVMEGIVPIQTPIAVQGHQQRWSHQQNVFDDARLRNLNFLTSKIFFKTLKNIYPQSLNLKRQINLFISAWRWVSHSQNRRAFSQWFNLFWKV